VSLESHDLDVAGKLGGLAAELAGMKNTLGNHITDEDIRDEKILKLVTEIREALPSMETHRQHHDAIELWLMRQKKRQEILDKILAESGKSVFIALLGALCFLLWEGLKVGLRAKGVS
jgi:hypothetical protein